MNRSSRPDHHDWCDRSRAALHAWLDRGIPAAPDHVRHHLAECSRCQGDWELARAFRDSLASRPAPMVPFGLSHRIARRVEQERAARRRRRQRLGALALVAAGVVLFGIVISAPRPEPKPEVVENPPPPDSVPIKVDDDHPSLRGGLVTASHSVATGVGRATGQTVAQTKKLLQESTSELPMTLPPDDHDPLPAGEDPASQSLDDLGNGATVAFRPVTDSTRRAFGMVFGSYAPPASPPEQQP